MSYDPASKPCSKEFVDDEIPQRTTRPQRTTTDLNLNTAWPARTSEAKQARGYPIDDVSERWEVERAL